MRGEGGTYNTGLLSGGGSLTAGPPEAGGSALLAASDSKASLGVNGWGISALLLPGTAAGEESLMATPALSRFEISSKPPMTATTVTAASFGTQNERSFLTPKDSLVRNTLRFYEAANDKGEGESASSPPASAPTGGGGGFVVPVAKAVIAGDGSSVTSFVPLFAKAFEQSPARAPAPGIDVENTSRVADDNRFESSSPPSASSEGHSGQSYEASANEDRSAISALSHGADLTVAAHEHHEDEWREGDYHAASLPGSPAVPEPATGVLLLMGGLAILFGKVRR